MSAALAYSQGVPAMMSGDFPAEQRSLLNSPSAMLSWVKNFAMENCLSVDGTNNEKFER